MSSKRDRSVKFIAILLSGCLSGHQEFAQAAPMPTAATDGKVYSTAFSVSFTVNNASVTSAAVSDLVKVEGVIVPDPAHANRMADIFVVERMGNLFYMRNLDGNFIPWNGKIADLRPARENVALGTSFTVDVYRGSYSSAAQHKVFVGYMLTGGSTLVYTPVPAILEIKDVEIRVSPLTFFGDKIETALIQTRCIACHVTGGLAKDSAMLLDRSSATSLESNFNTLKDLQKSKGTDYILAKVTNTIAHGGLVQINPGSADYNDMATMLGLLGGSTTAVTVPASNFFAGVTLQPRAETLRRAAIMLAARAPTASEIEAVTKGDENTLRATLRALMTGNGFHQFLTEGTNDRLLLEGVQVRVLNPNNPEYPKLMQAFYDIRKTARAAGISASEYNATTYQLDRTINVGMEKSVGELVAYIVEHERSYSEVLTADYMMMTPSINQIVDGGATFTNPANPYEFQPGRITNYAPRDGNLQYTEDLELGYHIIVPSQRQHSWQHVGILNHPAFMQRYPTTATNRNRARARWTLLNFFDIDIEKSTQRPTDPVALADKNNPTMNNPNCYACHEKLDPVAAAFQNYGENALYFNNGTDALDEFYKRPQTGGFTPYVQGDLWYRDMRTAGLLGQAITASGEPLKALANLLVSDPAFARATVKFWWPSVLNSEILLAPVVSTDVGYLDKLTAYQAQSAAVEQFARNFKMDYNLKNLLTDMMMSPWFRASTTARTDKLAAFTAAGVGVEKLLTPERLQRKISVLTGFNWGKGFVGADMARTTTALGDTYGGLYGGIDSFAVTRRTRDITPLMSAVAQTAALESACPIVLKEFILPDLNRLLFAGISELVTPLSQGILQLDLGSKNPTDWQTISLAADLDVGSNNILLGLTNPYCDYDAAIKDCRAKRTLYLDRFEMKAPGQASFQLFEITADISKDYKPGCNLIGASNVFTSGACLLNMRFNVVTPGHYEIRAVVAGQQVGTGNIAAVMMVEDGGDPQVSNSRGALLIKQKLVELHSKLLGTTYAIDSPQIMGAYNLFVQAWLEKAGSTDLNYLDEVHTCNWSSDISFFDGLDYPGSPLVLNKQDNRYEWAQQGPRDFLRQDTTDPVWIKQSWVVVLSYLLSHYDFLYE